MYRHGTLDVNSHLARVLRPLYPRFMVPLMYKHRNFDGNSQHAPGTEKIWARVKIPHSPGSELLVKAFSFLNGTSIRQTFIGTANFHIPVLTLAYIP